MTGTPLGVTGNALTASAGWYRGHIRARAVIPPAIGINNIYPAEAVSTGAIFSGGQANHQLCVVAMA